MKKQSATSAIDVLFERQAIKAKGKVIDFFYIPLSQRAPACFLLASIRISNGSPLVYYDHYTKLHIVASFLRAILYVLCKHFGSVLSFHLPVKLRSARGGGKC